MPALMAGLSLDELQDKAQEVFSYQPCLWQLQMAMAVLKSNKDVICIAATGSEKSLTFWLPLLAQDNGIQIIVTLLNILGMQNVQTLKKVGINAIVITAEMATHLNFKVTFSFTLILMALIISDRILPTFIIKLLLQV